MRESAAFCQRLMQQLDFTFTASFSGIKNSVMRPISGGSGVFRLNKEAFSGVRTGLWMYSPVVQFTKEVNAPAWQTIIRMYHSKAAPIYADAFKQNEDSESIFLAAAKLASETNEMEAAQQILQKAKTQASTERVSLHMPFTSSGKTR